MIGAGDIKMGSRPVWVPPGAAGAGGFSCAGWQLPEYGRSYYLSGVGLPGSGLHILCFICTGPRFGGSVEPYYLEARDGKEASFWSGTVPVLGVIGAD